MNPLNLDLDDFEIEPTDAELAAIELEWPLIAAEMWLVEAEANLLTAEQPTEMHRRWVRRAERRRLRALMELLNLTEAILDVREVGDDHPVSVVAQRKAVSS